MSSMNHVVKKLIKLDLNSMDADEWSQELASIKETIYKNPATFADAVLDEFPIGENLH